MTDNPFGHLGQVASTFLASKFRPVSRLKPGIHHATLASARAPVSAKAGDYQLILWRLQSGHMMPEVILGGPDPARRWRGLKSVQGLFRALGIVADPGHLTLDRLKGVRAALAIRRIAGLMQVAGHLPSLEIHDGSPEPADEGVGG